jgi:excisionase family DNA binding protein
MKKKNDGSSGNGGTFTVRQAAARLGYTRKYIFDLLYEGRFPGAAKIGRNWVIPAEAVQARLAARKDQ